MQPPGCGGFVPSRLDKYSTQCSTERHVALMPLTVLDTPQGLPILSISSCVPDDAMLAPSGEGAIRE
ncbi:hypothetical protein DPMN_045768 [Dreissena polymorpha]|uniref:Uncharacterized protein n=1 Tax=Dreissena polymorpha TaxID=45954 RepID=A0A9D4I1N9_DREPO|nr:hypothetical protein DPMN_045768 [Dreissena polymorpha]